ncbi:MAG: hypothetical protein ACRCZ0_10630 [Cetobacterium sp.]
MDLKTKIKDILLKAEIQSFIFCPEQNKAILITQEQTYHINLNYDLFYELEQFYINKGKTVESVSFKHHKSRIEKEDLENHFEKIKEIYDLGFSYREISEKIERPAAEVAYYIRFLIFKGKLKKRNAGILKIPQDFEDFEEMVKNKKTFEEIAKRFNCSVSSVKRIVSRKGGNN